MCVYALMHCSPRPLLSMALALLAGATGQSLADEADKLSMLTQRYEAAIERSVTPLRAAYLAELEALKVEYTKAGKLEDAIAVAEELEAVAGRSVDADVAEAERNHWNTSLDLDLRAEADLPALLTSRRWAILTKENAMTVGFREGGRVSGGKDGWTWSVEGLLATIHFRDGNSVLFDFSNRLGGIVLGEVKKTGNSQFLVPLPSP